MTRSKKLTHQMARYLGAETAEEGVGGLLAVLRETKIENVSPDALETLEKLPSFLDIVDAAYQNYEDNLATAERNISISSEELVLANRSIRSMVNSLGQGFLMFDETGICSPIYSKACETLLETVPAGKHIATVLRLSDEQKDRLNSLLRLVFSGSFAMSFDEIMRFAPQAYQHTGGVHIHLDYKAEATDKGVVDRIVVVATDITEQVRAREMVEQRKALFESLERIFHDRQSFGTYVRRLSEMLHMLDENERRHLTWEDFQREVHTLKGGAGMFRLNVIAAHLHDLETVLKCFTSDKSSVTWATEEACFAEMEKYRGLIKKEIDSLSGYLKDLFGIDIAKIGEESSFDKKILYDFADYLARFGHTDLRQEYLRRVCAESLTFYLRRFDFILGDLAARLNKKICPIKFTGPDIPIIVDRYRNLFESFVHLFRNIVDHGIEPPDSRKKAGKDEKGSVEIKMAVIEKNPKESWLHLEIRDDGAGIDTSGLRARLTVQHPNDHWDKHSDREILDSLLVSNISSRDRASIYSGRGVGVCSVYAEVLKAGGTMSLASVKNQGTLVTIEVPYFLEFQR